MTARRLPFNRPTLEGRELDYVHAAVTGGHTSSSGPFSERVEALLREAHGSEAVLLTTSCTDALEMAALLLDIEPGDTVIVPSFTFVSTALAFVRAGARLIFADIEPETLGIDPDHVASLIDDSVRAVVPVHYAGIACRVDELGSVLQGFPNISMIEDNAHGLFGTYRGQALGTFGRLSTLSFHETKNFVCGEGGALVVNQPGDVDRAHVLHDKGTNRRAFMMGQVDKYSWKDNGSSFGMSDILAGYLLGQLEQRERILAKRQRLFDAYLEALAPMADRLRLPTFPGDRSSAYHMFYVLMEDRKTRDHVLDAMNGRGVQATFHYVPLHTSDGGRRYAARPSNCPVTDDIAGRLLRLPFHNDMTDADIGRVVDALTGALLSR